MPPARSHPRHRTIRAARQVVECRNMRPAIDNERAIRACCLWLDVGMISTIRRPHHTALITGARGRNVRPILIGRPARVQRCPTQRVPHPPTRLIAGGPTCVGDRDRRLARSVDFTFTKLAPTSMVFFHFYGDGAVPPARGGACVLAVPPPIERRLPSAPCQN